ncbi:MAG: YciI family protein [Candidatus Binataceae bacterium]
MKFILMDLERRDEHGLVPEAESQRRVGKHQAALVRLTMQRSAANRSHLSINVGLPPTDESAIVRFERGKHSVTDGPFTETKELLAGFDVIDFDSKQDAIDWYKSIGYEHDGHVMEIRPVANAWLFYHGHRPSGALKYLLRFGGPKPNETDAQSEENFRASERVTTEYVRKGFMDESICWAGVRLADPRQAVTFRRNDGKLIVSDGPFTETREVVGGFTILDCASRDEAIEWARKYSYVEGDITQVVPCGLWWTQTI